MITEPGNEMAAVTGAGDRLPVCREQVTRTLKAALEQGRLTEDEYDERMGHASASRSGAELAALTADLPVGRMDAPAQPPTAKHVRTGVITSITAASVAAAILLWRPDNGLAFMVFVIAAVTVLVASIVTAGVMVDVRRQKRSGGQLPPGGRPARAGDRVRQWRTPSGRSPTSGPLACPVRVRGAGGGGRRTLWNVQPGSDRSLLNSVPPAGGQGRHEGTGTRQGSRAGQPGQRLSRPGRTQALAGAAGVHDQLAAQGATVRSSFKSRRKR